MIKRRLPLCLVLLFVCAAATAQAQTEASLPELVRRVKPAVVAIVTYDAKGNPLMSGSGFFVRPGQVITNMHVIEGARRVEVKTLDGKGRIYNSAGALAVDEEGDLALLSVEMPAERAHSSELQTTLPDEGEKIFVITIPYGLKDQYRTASSRPCAKCRTSATSCRSPRPSHTAIRAVRSST